MSAPSTSSSIRRVDGLAKVTGTAVYGNDIILPGMLYGVCRYADIAAGKIDKLDLNEALAIPGVVKIATYQDIPGEPVVGIMVKDYLPIIKDEVVFTVMSLRLSPQKLMKPPVWQQIKFIFLIRLTRPLPTLNMH